MSSEQRRGRGGRPDGRGPGSAPRTLAEDLRGRDDAALAALLRVRPDLLSPVPGDLTQLATRAGTRASVVRALERLDQFTLQTAEALAVAPAQGPAQGLAQGPAQGSGSGSAPGRTPGHPEESTPRVRAALAALLPGEEAAERLPHALAELRARALVWGDEERPRLVRTARELLISPSPTGLGPTLAEAAGSAKLSPARLQEVLGAAGLPATHDPVSALAALAALFGDPDRMAALLAQAPEGAEAVLRKLEWGPPYGAVDVNAPSPPVAWLLDRGLLIPAGPDAPGGPAGTGSVVLPREAALHLRGGRAHRELEPVAPRVTAARAHATATVDATAAGQAMTALSTVEELLGYWETEPPTVLRAGGLGVRDLKRTAVALDLPEPAAAFWVELAYAAGLLASDGEADEVYAPTPAYDEWLRAAPAERWAVLATAWMSATRVAGLVGERDAKGRSLAALGPGLDRGSAPEVRRRSLGLLATLEAGSAPDRTSVLERLRWERPLQGAREARESPAERGARGTDGRATDARGTDGRATDGREADARGTDRQGAPGSGAAGRHADATGGLRSRLAHQALDEAESLGVTGRGALASYARPLLEDATREAAKALTPHLPEPVSEVLLQADLTAVAPGPLERELATSLSVLADVESKGGATVYRFTPGSVRRALDTGRTAADLHAFLTAHSRTPVPQPLSYLIDDVARKHGQLRVGAASSYVRCDDDALLAEILADRRSAPLRLRLLAPTVLASPAPPDQLLARLREMGYAPAAESAEGDVLLARPDAHRTPPRTPPDPVPDGPPQPDGTLLAAAIRAIRAGDRAATLPHKPKAPTGQAPTGPVPEGGLPRTVMAETLATMQSATLTGSHLWIGYVNADGAASQRVIAPVKVEGGFVTAYDHTADEVRTYPLHRITGVAEVTES
ncbi:helicase C-terminal domain-containing protein [Streptomyces sp. NBC_01795]|uniref:helicase-associated domain-containing protein n=1 Tax=unclassified Streptomyces TaxID=2593676 RepID=UPI002DD8E3FF|nr:MULTISPECIES: helicase-associated domain-containing protein [unclassified Streptomyces]WSA93980.1 helicase C-terminal domain-containing protein [Streptomyces sp. NBC_01795]WSB78406.1 helicase C-terminal domain-containing protein [Streptomyces sp. NBC_01775]